MRKILFLVFSLILIGAAFSISCRPSPPAAIPTDTTASVLKTFQDPPSEYRSAPLWVWNDRIATAQIDEQMADFRAHGIGGVFVHPRPGLITPYLSEEWLSLFRHAVDAGKRLGMKVWIYDENSYPSGFAGGHVPAAMPDAVRTGLRLVKMSALPAAFESEPVVLRKTDTGFEDITAAAKANPAAAGSGEFYVFDLNRQKPSPWHGGFTYVDLMRRDVTEKFLDVTLNAYKRVAGDEFGGVVPGTFQDEAEINPAGGSGMVVVNHTPALFDAFRAKWGYDLRPNLPSLYEETGDWMRVRHDFYATLLSLFIDNWAKPYSEYCTANKLAFTGHYWEHEWPRPVVNPDNLAFAAYAHMPGIDILMNDFQTDTHAQFGNARSVREIRSAANQSGAKRTMSETYGASGWDISFLDQKRIADWEYALGVNFVNQHLSYVTIMGARKRDHPQSFSYHEPWWNDYRHLADYFGRMSVATSLGAQMNRTLVIEPTTTGWMYQAPGKEPEKIRNLGRVFQDFVNVLESTQAEYDLGSEHTLGEKGRVVKDELVLGQRAYDLVVIPPGTENLEEATVKLLLKYLSRGGKVVANAVPTHVNGRPDDRMAKALAAHPGVDISRTLLARDIAFQVKPGTGEGPEYLFHQRRKLADAELLLLVNSSPRRSSAGTVIVSAGSCEAWDPFTGKTSPYPSANANGKLRIEYDLPLGGSLLLCLKPGAGEGATLPSDAWTNVPASPTRIDRIVPNVLTLDYCDLTLGGKTERDLYFYDAQLRTFRAHGLDRNPWDSAVQYKTNILDEDKFAPESGFEATFRFDIASGPAAPPLDVVVERPGLFRVFINGKETAPRKGAWWLDKAFGMFRGTGRLGGNEITLKARPFTIHTELEPVYVLGDFGLAAATPGFRVTAPPALKLGPWKDQGLPFYSGRVAYTKTVKIPEDAIGNARFGVELGAWLGSVAEVKVNGRPAGMIAFPPYRLDVTEAIVPGTNTVEVDVVGTLKNTLGPHHNSPGLGRAWPGSFQQGAKGGRPPGKEYDFVGYGLFEDFKIIRK
jgi:hypothetical protein